MYTMEYMENKNNVIEFILLRLTENPKKQKIIFIGFLVVYIVSVVGNALIVVTIIASPLLESPMYYFLSYLSFIDACYSSVFSYCSLVLKAIILKWFVIPHSIRPLHLDQTHPSWVTPTWHGLVSLS